MFFGAFRGRGFTTAPAARPASAGVARRAAAAAAADAVEPEDACDADAQEEVEDEEIQADPIDADHERHTLSSPAPSASAQQMYATHTPGILQDMSCRTACSLVQI